MKPDLTDVTKINPASLAIGFTQSELTTLDACAEKWYRGYNQLLRKKGMFHWHNVYGTAAHDTLDKFYQGLGLELATLQIPPDALLTTADEREQRYFEELLRVQMTRYTTYYQDDAEAFKIEATEQIIDLEFEGIRFSGKLDLIVSQDDCFGPWDHKTSSMFTPQVFQGWNFRFQFMFYAWLMWRSGRGKPNTIWWNGLKKPQLRQKQNESFEELIVRIEVAMVQEPEKYFVRQKLPIEDPDWLQHFEDRILRPKLNRLHLLTEPETSGIIIESLARNMNTSECVRFGKPCEFLELCKDGWKAEGFNYTARETKHEELETAE